ncbi:GNAT family N-acetyltransferase [Methanocella sp. MCL-LM]|uniref:GNAT family N-acetyltransferase n=1 Tax=Methanocella sp. MCL-LM TaxID=3412035 RepID=UPI003C7084D1
MYDRELSLVAVRSGSIVGHILFNPMVIRTPSGDVPALYLGPIAVRPEQQRQGVGSALMRAGLEKCREKGHRIVILCGHPEYYPRFGFTPAREKGLEAPEWIPDDAFMVLELLPGALNGVRGTAIIPYEFPEAE